MSATTITVTIDNEERGSTTVVREIELGPLAEQDITLLSREEAEEFRRHRQVGIAHRLDSVAREAAAVATSLHFT